MTHTRPDGWWYPYIFVAGFAVIIAVNGVLISFALGTWTGLETKDHYVKGVAYNEALAATEAQKALGWTAQLTMADGRLSAVYTDKADRPLSGLRVEAMITRPTHEGYDFTVILSPTPPGRYEGDVIFPLPGQWDIRLVADGNGVSHQHVQRIKAP